ncbi:MAG: TrmH family RNA methyltransferase [Flavitalea sp.]
MLMKSKIKYIQSLSQKKFREEEGVFVAEGPKIVEEILHAGNVLLKELYATRKWIDEHPEVNQELNTSLVEISDRDLERISLLQTPNQVMGVFTLPVFPEFDPANKVSLMLDTIQDPGNLGTILRCADWFGVKQVICSNGCVDTFNPKVIQSTMGSITRVQVIYADLISIIESHNTIPVYAAMLNGKEVAQYKPIKQGFILIGNESKGIDPALLPSGHHRITIPRKGNAESLNAAVATGIILAYLVGELDVG